MLVAVVDVVLLTAIATLGAFLYNMAAALLGGIEVTLAEDAALSGRIPFWERAPRWGNVPPRSPAPCRAAAPPGPIAQTVRALP